MWGKLNETKKPDLLLKVYEYIFLTEKNGDWYQNKKTREIKICTHTHKKKTETESAPS